MPFKRFAKSVWFFPGVLTVLLVLLTLLQLSGSSIGTYHSLFYGSEKDHDLVFGEPRSIRSDEWLVNSQMIIAQKNNNFKRFNDNIGNGQDMSLLVDAPYKEWSVIFKPHLLAFFVIPFDNAFAFRWWFMAYLLMLSCYFFLVQLVPTRRLVSALISIGFLFSPFIQWWYLSGTMGVIYFALFGALFFMKMMQSARIVNTLLWGVLLTYVATCFVLILYPPYQIPVAVAVFAFVVGYTLEKARDRPWKKTLQQLGIVGAFLIVSGVLALTFLLTRSQAVETIQNTAYPGQRKQLSGGYDLPHVLSGHLGAQFRYADTAANYTIPGLTNQSESSNFLLLFPFLLLPSLYVCYWYYKKDRRLDYPLLATNATILVLLGWLFIPGLGFFGRLTLLEVVPHTRLLIGLGVLNLLQLSLFIRRYLESKDLVIKHSWIMIYSILTLLAELLIGLYAGYRLPGFISLERAIIFAVPVPVIVYLLLRRQFVWGCAVMTAFMLYMSFSVNPIYQGTEVLTKTPLSQTIQQISDSDDSRWATEHFLLENFSYMNGARSLSGVYSYPQLDIWRNASPEASEDIYNRYAHTIFAFDRSPNDTISTTLSLGGGDSFGISTEPCSHFLKDQDVRYLLVASKLAEGEACASLIERIDYPAQKLYIYRLDY